MCKFFKILHTENTESVVGPFLGSFRHFLKIFFLLPGKCGYFAVANVQFFGQMCQKSPGKCVIFRANVPFWTLANVLRVCDT